MNKPPHGKPLPFKNAMGYLSSVVNWDCLDGCWGHPHIRPMDIDGTIEVKGKFLYLEVKGYTADLKPAQRIYYENRVKDGISTVVVAWGDRATTEFQPERLRVYYPNGQVKEHPTSSLEEFRALCSRWDSWARGRNR